MNRGRGRFWLHRFVSASIPHWAATHAHHGRPASIGRRYAFVPAGRVAGVWRPQRIQSPTIPVRSRTDRWRSIETTEWSSEATSRQTRPPSDTTAAGVCGRYYGTFDSHSSANWTRSSGVEPPWISRSGQPVKHRQTGASNRVTGIQRKSALTKAFVEAVRAVSVAGNCSD